MNRIAEEQSWQLEGHPEAAEGFDYMKADNESAHAHALAQEYMTKLVHESAPASYLPMLADMVQTATLPVPIQVRHMILWSLTF